MEPQRALSVSDAVGIAKRALETLQLTIVGEVTELTDRPGYKAIYFTLSDGSAMLPCIVWRDAYARASAPLTVGSLVHVTGYFTAYAAKGRMQFQVRGIEAGGEGVLRVQVAALARTLEGEGLMASSRKRAIPEFPQRIGLVTSPRGKAVHDVLRTLRRRYPAAEVVVAGVPVEGAEAIASIVAGLKAIGEAGVDVVILARGGGCYEDFMPFNSEAVARAVAACPVPVVTGIGHEPDDSIADIVADLRASTPTAAAEAVASHAEEVAGRFSHASRAMGRALLSQVRAADHRLRLFGDRPVLRDPRAGLAARAQALDLARDALASALPRRLERHRGELDRARERLRGVIPVAGQRARSDLSLAAARLDDLSPLAILGRGYAVCRNAADRIVRAVEDVTVGERVRVTLGNGSLACSVEDIAPSHRDGTTG